MNLCKEYTEGAQVSCAEDVVKYCKDFRKADREYFVVIGLNTRKKIIYKEIAFIGTLDSSIVHPREVFKQAIIRSAACIITIHNHPSGGLTPSDEDLVIWEKLERLERS
jgi:DNA repair protein RadC